MDIFTGLTAQQIGVLRHCRSYRDVKAGDLIVREGDPAASLFSIVSGAVDVFRTDDGREVPLARLERGEVFGEMGFLVQSGRTASVRAAEDCLLFEVPMNAVEVLLRECDPNGAIKLLQNLICILSERLRRQNGSYSVGFVESRQPPQELKKKIEEARKVMQRALPTLKKFSPKDRVPAGEYLFHQGEASTGFYLIQKGMIEIVRSQPEGTERVLSRLYGPTVVGEMGYFTAKERSAGVRAVEDVELVFFSGKDFEKLKSRDPQLAMETLLAATQMIVFFLVLENLSSSAEIEMS